jgi:hypothetical protein
MNGGGHIVLSRQRGGMWVPIAKEVRRNVSKANGVIKGEGKNSGGKIVLSRERGREVSTLIGRNWWGI